ncbi:hypothetical protein D3C72_2073830 [compost metagenome]
MTGMSFSVSMATSARFFSSGIWKPSGFWKLGITMQAATPFSSISRASSPMSMPSTGSVATSMARMPSRSIAWSMA